MTIIAYRSSDDIDVQFEDGSIRQAVRFDHFKNGKIKKNLKHNPQNKIFRYYLKITN